MLIMCVRYSVLRLCSNIYKLTIGTFQLELGEFAPGLEPLEFVSGECSSSLHQNLGANAPGPLVKSNPAIWPKK